MGLLKAFFGLFVLAGAELEFCVERLLISSETCSTCFIDEKAKSSFPSRKTLQWMIVEKYHALGI